MTHEFIPCTSCQTQAEAMKKIMEAGLKEKKRFAEIDDRAFRNMAGLYTRNYQAVKELKELNA